MKRDHQKMTGQPHPHPHLGGGGGGGGGGDQLAFTSSKAKMWAEEEDGGMDELLAVLGYKVKSSEMADVAQKLEQLEMAMGTSQTDGAISHLSDIVHYNPSDISGWLGSMLTELNPNPAAPPCQPSPYFNPTTNFTSHHQSHQQPVSLISDTPDLPNLQSDQISSSSYHDAASTSNALFQDDSEYDLSAIVAAYSPRTRLTRPSSSSTESSTITAAASTTPSNKRIKHEPSSSSPPTVGSTSAPPEQSRPLVVVDSQQAGVRLVHTLMACAEAVQNDNLKVADALVKQIGLLAVSQAGAMRKVATYFAEALARRIYKIRPDPSLTLIDAYATDVLQSHFYETCPYLKFAHFTANQAILEAFAGANRVHVVDFSMKQGLQWPALIQALALRPGGPPVFRLTGIGPPQPENTDALQEVGWKLAHFAKDVGLQFYYRGFVCDNLADLDPDLLDIRVGGKGKGGEEEVVAVNSVFELHRLLARPGGIEKVLRNVRAMKPKIFTVVEQEANHNGPGFLDRFNVALHYYSAMFDSLEGFAAGGGGGVGLTESAAATASQNLALSEVYLGRQICNVVACEGAGRVERHETLVQWRARLESAGFYPAHLGSNAFKQASILLELFAGGDGYEVEENSGCLMLGWHTRPLIATSAWQLSGGSGFRCPAE